MGKKLSELIRDSGSQISGTEQGRWQSELSQVALELIPVSTFVSMLYHYIQACISTSLFISLRESSSNLFLCCIMPRGKTEAVTYSHIKCIMFAYGI